MPQRNHVLLGLMVTLLLGLGAPAVTRAQGAAWECSASATGPVADATPAVAAATSPAPVAFPDAGGELTVFAAASLTDAFTQIEADLEVAHPGFATTYNFGGSQALVTQLSERAEADVFASANQAQMTAAQEAGVIAGEPVTFVANRLVVVVPFDNPAALAVPADLAQDGLRLVLAQAEVPVGNYSRQAICLMAADAATYGDDFVGRVAANVVSEEEDVRDVLAKVQLGEADAGIVYASDAFIAGDQVHLIAIPDDVNVLATYPIAPITGGDAALAAAFIAYVLGADGQATLAEFGFEPIP
jgi:molybdate transport system substrate-binding protein